MNNSGFVDRRRGGQPLQAGRERRQFADGRENYSPAVRELAEAVDRYKLENHRRFINYEELLHVVQSLGYVKPSDHLPIPINGDGATSTGDFLPELVGSAQ